MTRASARGRRRSPGTRCREWYDSLSVSSGPVAKTAAASVVPREVSRELLARLLEAGHVDPQVLVGREALGHLDRDAVGRVQLEGVAARDRVGAGRLGLAERVVEQPQAVLEVPEELLLLLADDRLDAGDALAQLGIGPLHHLGDGRHELVQERLAPAHLVAVEHRPAQQPADRRSPPSRGRGGRSRGCRTCRPARGRRSAAADAVVAGRRRTSTPQTLGRGRDDRPEDVDVEVRRHALQHGGRALQAHAGVDVLARQRPQVVRRVAHAVELREDQVPDLDRLAARRGWK